MPPSDADRSKARRLRKLRKAGTLDPDQKAWLANYEATQKQTRAHDSAPASDEAASSSSAPVHTTEVVTAAEASSWASVPMLPPGAPEGGAAEGAPDQRGAPGGVNPAPPPPGETPIADPAPPPGPTEDQMERGATRFAMLVTALNAAGVKAGLELAPVDGLRAVDELLEKNLGTDLAKVSTASLGIIFEAAKRVALKHPVLCASIPYEDEIVVLGASSASLVALYFRHVVKRKDEQPTEEHSAPPPKAAPARPAPAPTSAPKNGAPPPAPPLDFSAMPQPRSDE